MHSKSTTPTRLLRELHASDAAAAETLQTLLLTFNVLTEQLARSSSIRQQLAVLVLEMPSVTLPEITSARVSVSPGGLR